MSAGNPLTDEDRLPWLALIRTTAEKKCKEEWEDQGYKIKEYKDGGIGRPGIIIACSALKRWYRDILRGEVRVEGENHKDDEGKEVSPWLLWIMFWVERYGCYVLWNAEYGSLIHPFLSLSSMPFVPFLITLFHPVPSSSYILCFTLSRTRANPQFHPSRTNLHTLFLYCHGSPETLKDRITARKGHFMGTQMLDSQLKTLEDPRGEEGVAWVDIKASVEEVGRRAVEGVRGLIGDLKEGE
jgi:gluconate kinase